MRSNGRALLGQAHTCIPSCSGSSSSGSTSRHAVQHLTARMARASVNVASPSPQRRLLTTSSRSLMAASTAPAQAKQVEASAAVEAGAEEQAAPAPRWTPASKRVGLIGKKVGMTSFFMPDGRRVPATLLRITDNQISAHIGFSAPETTAGGQPIAPRKLEARMAYTALQVAATNTHSKYGITHAERGHLRKAGISQDKKVLHEFKVTRDALVPLGTYLSVAHFVPGQKVDVQAKSRGRGFQGAMKRHGFKGLRASHGVSVSHRSHGSTGQNQDPGRVFPGKKMAGRMGGKQSTMLNLEVLRIDTLNDLVVVQGNVPGPEGGHVFVSDAKFDLVKRAAIAYKRGVLPDNKGMATGKEGADAYLPAGIVDLPFPAGTRQLARELPDIIEVGAKEAPAASS